MRWNEHYGPIPAATDRWTRSPCSSLLLWSAAKTFPGDGASYQSRQTKRFADVISVINSAAPAPPVISKYNPIRTTPLTLRWNARGHQFHENHARLDIFQSRWWETGGCEAERIDRGVVLCSLSSSSVLYVPGYYRRMRCGIVDDSGGTKRDITFCTLISIWIRIVGLGVPFSDGRSDSLMWVISSAILARLGSTI